MSTSRQLFIASGVVFSCSLEGRYVNMKTEMSLIFDIDARTGSNGDHQQGRMGRGDIGVQ